VRRLAAALAVLVCCATVGCTGGGERSATSTRTIEIFGPYRGAEADRFVETLRPFTRATGIPVRYIGSVDFVDDLLLRTGEGNDPPDIAVVPQPGLVRQLADEGTLVPLDEQTTNAVIAHTPPSLVRLSRIGGKHYSIPFRVSVKSLVWYRPEVFAKHGWTPPQTLDQLADLVRRIQREGLTPWCFSMAAGTATGWAATDWVEDLVLRTAGISRYRAWASGTLPFSSPAIESAFDRFRSLVLAPGRVVGGLADVVETPVEEAGLPLFDDPPGCVLYKQADFAVGWMPSGTTIGPDGDVNWFVLPGISGAPPPLLLGGDQIVQFRRDPDVDALMAYLAGPTAGESWVREGGFISPKVSIPPSAYPEQYAEALARALEESPVLAFDASDQMSPAIGSGLLWSSITSWVAGVEDYDTFAKRIDTALADAASTADEVP
jgi:alpha-glucoside transport system substrate-binding protein